LKKAIGSPLDHANRRFGRLTAIQATDRRMRRQVVWKCQCDCGNTVYAGATALQMGNKKSCGCLSTWRGCGEISGAYWCHVRNMAKKRGINLDVSIEEAWNLFLKQERKCVYTGLPLAFIRNFAYGHGQSASLDRINSYEAYTSDNIQWVHRKINLMKGTLSQDEFIQLCHLVGLNYLEKSSR
jgi:hypothetical protein